MAKIICIGLCILAVTSVFAVTDEEKQAIKEAITPLIEECSKQHGVTQEDISAAKKSLDVDSINQCFIGCLMKKAGWINDKGDFDPEAGITGFKKYLKNEDDINKIREVGKLCTKVNDEPISGDSEVASCERAKLVMACLLEQKTQFPGLITE